MENKQANGMNAEDCVLLLVDYQAKMFYGIESHSRTDIKNNVMALAKGAQILGIPTVLTSISAGLNGPFLTEVLEMFPDIKVIDRKLPSFDALLDQEVLDAVMKTGKKQIVISGLWTSMCMTLTALHAVRSGFEVFGVLDTAGSEDIYAHNTAVQRMIQAGIVPCTWMQTVSEWMNNWRNPKAGDLHMNVYSKYSGYFGQKEKV